MIFKNHSIIILLLLCLANSNLLAQNQAPRQTSLRTISGTLTDALTQAPLPAVDIVVSNSKPSIHTYSNLDGVFKLLVPNTANTLRITYPGYTTYYLILPNSDKHFNIALKHAPPQEEVKVPRCFYPQMPKP